jgi:hypothetical protein
MVKKQHTQKVQVGGERETQRDVSGFLDLPKRRVEHPSIFSAGVSTLSV